MVTGRVAAPTETLRFMRQLWDLVHALDVASKRMARTLGVTGPQRIVIRLIGLDADRTASEIAAALGQHPSTLSGVLARLEERELIVREVDADDRRRVRFRLTAAGKRVDREKRGTIEAATRRAVGRATSEQIASFSTVIALLTDELARVE